jgi:cytochrome c-type biogenesis protein CcsB
MRKIYPFLISAPLMGALLILLATAMGIATFIENDYGTAAAKALIYNAWWFETFFILLAINLFGNLIRFNMWRWQKMPVTLFHLSFFVIIAGAGITRYFGEEGTMHIRENDQSNAFLSTDNYITLKINDGKEETVICQKTFFSPITPFEFKASAGGVTVKSKAFVPNAYLQPVQLKNGKTILRPVYQSGVQSLPDAVVLECETNGQTAEITVVGKQSQTGIKTSCTIGNTSITVSYGAIRYQLPFSLRLNDFQLERYPGSHSPSSFASEVTLVDNEKQVRENHRIFMNNILNYRGFRFYQSSYDTDEKGTILSVNQDYTGTLITYMGYFLMALGMFLALVMPNTRFRMLYSLASKLSKQRKGLLTLFLALTISYVSMAQEIKMPHPVTPQMGADFGNLWVQDNEGRIEPLNSLNSEIARKLVKHNSFHSLSADQMVLSMLVDREYWQQVPLITVTMPPLRQTLGIREKKASFRDFFTSDGLYKIGEAVEAAYRKKPSQRDKVEQELIKVDEQVNVFYLTQSTRFFKIFPIPGRSHATWLMPDDVPDSCFTSADSLFVCNGLALYTNAIANGNMKHTAKYLNAISQFQNRYGAEILPSSTHQKVEVFYNNANIFMMMMPFLMIMGAILLLFQFITLLKPQFQFKTVNNIGLWLLMLAFVAYTVGLGMRWYISGHAPWSNGYESMLYIGYSTFGAGLIFGRKNTIALSVSTLFTSIVLMVAHLSWMNPEITNLVPVLKSYWLTLHVAVIVASYGFLGLSALLGFVNLIIYSLKNNANKTLLGLTIDELSAISEMSITVGLYLLTIGSFLGGIWANESWGRYWGWDPKETWSAVTILVYAFVLHMRLIPGLKGTYAFNLMALLAFSSVIMTYLGVNYYLTGMHSYGKGESIPVPVFVYYSVVIVSAVAVYAWYNEQKVEKRAASL